MILKYSVWIENSADNIIYSRLKLDLVQREIQIQFYQPKISSRNVIHWFIRYVLCYKKDFKKCYPLVYKICFMLQERFRMKRNLHRIFRRTRRIFIVQIFLFIISFDFISWVHLVVMAYSETHHLISSLGCI